MSLQKINATDRIPTSVLSNGAIRYGVYDNNGTLLRYEYIKREDEPSVAGTNVNKALFDKIDNNFAEELANICRVDKYNIPELVIEEKELQTGNIIPTISWVEKTAYTDYTNTYLDGDIEVITSSTASSSNRPSYVFDDSTSDYWIPENGNINIPTTLTIDFTWAQKITKFNTLIGMKNGTASYLDKWMIEGSNDGTNWTTLFDNGTAQATTTEISLTTTGFYRYYRFNIKYTSTTKSLARIYLIQVSEYYTRKNILNLNTSFEGYSSYNSNDIFLLKVPDSIKLTDDTYLNINNLGRKIINNIEDVTNYCELLYDGTKFVAYSVRDEINKIKQAIINLGGVI